MDSFYVVLPSNTREEDKTSNFTVRLADPLELDSNWTVALSSIIFPHSFSSFGIDEVPWIGISSEINIVDRKGSRVELREHIAKLPKLVFSSIDELETTLNENINALELTDWLYGKTTRPPGELESAGIKRKTRSLSKEQLDGWKKEQARILEEGAAAHERLTAGQTTSSLKPTTRKSSVTTLSAPPSLSATSATATPPTPVLSKPPVASVPPPTASMSPQAASVAPPATSVPPSKPTPSLSTKPVSVATPTPKPVVSAMPSVSPTPATPPPSPAPETESEIATPGVPYALPLRVRVDGTVIPQHKYYKYIEFLYHPSLRKFQLKIKTSLIKFIRLSKHMCYMLGFICDKIYNNDYAKYSPDPTGGLGQLYVYAPKLVENTIVGNVSAPLLRVVHITGKNADIIERLYIGEHHHRLASKRISEISIEIRAPNGSFIDFNWGNIILTLHFQRNLL